MVDTFRDIQVVDNNMNKRKRRLVPSYIITLSLLSTILGFYLIGERLGNGELIVERTEFIVETHDCFEPLHSPILGQYKYWHISNSSAPKVVNVGFPKIGSSTLNGFLSKNLMGYNVSHWNLPNNNGLIGSCMESAIKNNQPPLMTCGNYAAYTEMDVAEWGCQYPQVLPERKIRRGTLGYTSSSAFRNVTDWIRSMTKWLGLRNHLSEKCVFPEYNFTIGIGRKDEEMEDLFCQHVKRVRNFVLEHPTLTLIEYSISNKRA